MRPSFSIVAIVFLTEIAAGNVADFIFSECQANEDGCQDCYISLVKSLLGNDGNVFINLSMAYFPPIVDPPNSVIVNYHFVNDSMDKIDTWFWPILLESTFCIQYIRVYMYIYSNILPPYNYFSVNARLLNLVHCWAASAVHFGLSPTNPTNWRSDP